MNPVDALPTWLDRPEVPNPTWDVRASLTDDISQWVCAITAENADSLTAEVLLAIASDIDSGGPLSEVLPVQVRLGDMVPLRLLASLHLLALEGHAERIVDRLPTLGGRSPAFGDATSRPARLARFRDDVRAVLVDNREAVRRGVATVPQTQAPQRVAYLRLGLAHLGTAQPVRLVDIGASAGIALRADHLPGFRSSVGTPMPVIVERMGCDPHPVDLTTDEGRHCLLSHVWVDDVEGFESLSRVIARVGPVPATVVRSDGATFVAGLPIREGVTTVLWHSALMLYLDPPARHSLLAAIDRCGAMATPQAPVVHLAWEFDAARTNATVLTMRQWHGSLPPTTRILATLPRGAPWPELESWPV